MSVEVEVNSQVSLRLHFSL